jgi:hypothetical protein
MPENSLWVRGVLTVKRKTSCAEKLLRQLAQASPRDAVRLLFINGEDSSELDGLDLSLLSEIKRGAKGETELKFINKLAVIKELSELENSREISEDGGMNFYQALDRSAQLLSREQSDGA